MALPARVVPKACAKTLAAASGPRTAMAMWRSLLAIRIVLLSQPSLGGSHVSAFFENPPPERGRTGARSAPAGRPVSPHAAALSERGTPTWSAFAAHPTPFQGHYHLN